MGQKLALVTIVVGDSARRMAASTNPLMKRYADRAGADFVVIDRPRFGALYYEKFQLYDLFPTYDRILYVDNDVLISPDSPDLFREVNEAEFAAASEETWSKSGVCKSAIFNELGEVAWRYPYFNAGVMLASRAHRAVFDPEYPLLSQWANDRVRSMYPFQGDDQTYFNYRVNQLNLEMKDLTYVFNHTRSIQNTKTRFRSWFIHYAGPSGHRYGERIEQIEKDARVLASPFTLFLSRRLLTYRWLADRFDVAFVQYLLQRPKP